MELSEWIAVFVLLWAVIDPVGTVPVFISATTGMDARQRRHTAKVAAIAAAGILLFFIVVGEILLRAMGVPLEVFQISGGLILFLFALTMVFGTSKPDEEVGICRSVEDTAIFPLATPSIASPGAMMAVVLLTDNSSRSMEDQVGVTLMMLTVVGCAYLLMRAAGWIGRKIGSAGASVISRVMGMILAAIASTHVLEGLRHYFASPPPV